MPLVDSVFLSVDFESVEDFKECLGFRRLMLIKVSNTRGNIGYYAFSIFMRNALRLYSSLRYPKVW